MAQQCFAHNLNFHKRWMDQIQAIFLNVFSLLSNKYPELGVQGIVVLKLCYLYSWSIKREIFLQRKAKKEWFWIVILLYLFKWIKLYYWTRLWVVVTFNEIDLQAMVFQLEWCDRFLSQCWLEFDFSLTWFSWNKNE